MLTNMSLNVLRKEVGQMKCENCLHYEACKSMVSVIERATMYSIAMRVCNNYADKDLYIKLPRKLNLPEELYRYMFDDNYQAFAIKCKVVKITGYGFILKHPIDGREWEYTYEHVIIGTRKEKPVDTGGSELVPFSFS